MFLKFEKNAKHRLYLLLSNRIITDFLNDSSQEMKNEIEFLEFQRVW